MFDVCIVGGGVVGSAIFNKLTRLGKNCVLIEKENDVGFGASRANTALIHSGIDCQPNTLKAKLNVRGNELFPSLAKRLGVPFVQNGHLIVGNSLEKLKNLIARAKANGVKGVKLLNKKQLYKLEPNLNKEIEHGLFVPSGGFIESYNFSVALAEEAIINGGVVKLSFETKKISRLKDGFKLVSKEGEEVLTKVLINACGAGVNDINKLLKAETYDYVFRRGEYFVLDRSCSNFVSHPVFPLPTEVSKGILVSPTIHGNVLIGPTSIISDNITKTTKEGLNKIKSDASKTFCDIPYRENIRVFSGVRVVLGDDFLIEKSEKVDNLITLAGICSPGLSASPAIAEFVAKMLGLNPEAEILGLIPRKPKTILNGLSLAEQNKIIQQNPDFGKVVCRCEDITLGEIKECLNSPLPARSVDAVKRRTRAGMGRCQSGFCIFQIMEEISKSQNIKFEDVLKDSHGSKIIKSKIKSN